MVTILITRLGNPGKLATLSTALYLVYHCGFTTRHRLPKYHCIELSYAVWNCRLFLHLYCFCFCFNTAFLLFCVSQRIIKHIQYMISRLQLNRQWKKWVWIDGAPAMAPNQTIWQLTVNKGLCHIPLYQSQQPFTWKAQMSAHVPGDDLVSSDILSPPVNKNNHCWISTLCLICK